MLAHHFTLYMGHNGMLVGRPGEQVPFHCGGRHSEPVFEVRPGVRYSVFDMHLPPDAGGFSGAFASTASTITPNALGYLRGALTWPGRRGRALTGPDMCGVA
jgi:hypothetical protein